MAKTPKIPRLPEIDLARITVMTPDQQHNQLADFDQSGVPLSYAPFRKSAPDILCVASGFISPTKRTSWDGIAANIRSDSQKPNERRSNLQVAKGLYQWADARKVTGRRLDLLPFPIGLSEKVVFWNNMVLNVEERAVVPFLDPRRTKGLTYNARQFTFSLMHERIRAAGGDLESVRLAIIQFANEQKGPRRPIVYFDDGIELLPLAALNGMVRTTYEIWAEVREKIRRTGTTGK
jgi:hypothetical protein